MGDPWFWLAVAGFVLAGMLTCEVVALRRRLKAAREQRDYYQDECRRREEKLDAVGARVANLLAKLEACLAVRKDK